MVRYIGRSILAALLMLSACRPEEACQHGAPPHNNIDGRLTAHIHRIRASFERQDTRTSTELSIALRDSGRAAGDTGAYLYGLVYLAQSHYLATGETDSIEASIDEALALAGRRRDCWALATIHNLLGSHALFRRMDYGKGLTHLMEGLRYAELSGDGSRIFPLKSNLALAHYFRNDPAGLRYAVEVYESGREHRNEFMRFTGAVITSYMHYMLGHYDRALAYIEDALPLAAAYSDQRGVYARYGDILMALGRKEEAVRSYRKALAEGNDTGRFSDIDAHLGYGRYLEESGRYAEALEMMRQGVAAAAGRRQSQKLYLLYHRISSLCETLGDPAEALNYYKLYHAETDSLFNARQEQAISDLKVGFEKERHADELRLQDLAWQKRLQVVVLLLVIAAILAVGASVLYYRRERGYRQILKLRHEAMEREKWYRAQLQRCPNRPAPETDYRTEIGQNDKLYELFARLQELMSAQEIYRRHDLSREAVAAMLSTNRTYLSEAISRHTGLSFVYYVNSFRLEAAVKILSDPDDETPIKAMVHELGFRSMSTFYRLFLAAKGVPPSQFREEHRKRRR